MCTVQGVSQRQNSLCNITTIDMSQLYWKLLHMDRCRHDFSVTRSKKTSCSYCDTVKKEVVYFSNTLLNICHNIRCRIPRIPEYGSLQLILNRHSRTQSAKIGCPWHKTQHISSKQISVMDDNTHTFVSVTHQFELIKENYLLRFSRCLIRTVKSFKRSLKS